MKTLFLVMLVVIMSGCAVRYKSGESCWSFEMVSTENWCEKQRAIDRASRAKADELLIEQLRSMQRNEEQP